MTPQVRMPRDHGWVGDESTRTCHGCGVKLILKRDSICFERFPEIRTWHFACWLESR